MKIGVLAVQGAFIEHEKALSTLGISHFEIRQSKDLLTSFDGLILPGGESTVMGKLLRDLKLFAPLKQEIEAGLPVFGTCAGLILLSKTIAEDETVHFGTLNVTTKRNAYGRQLGSFKTFSNFKGIGSIPMTFIRAPYIEAVHDKTEILATVNHHIVAARNRTQLGTAFHPELTEDVSVHQYFIDMIKENTFEGAS
ncbi:MAG: pyridoxal 5'-phosphate synthase glutaminase subunit PdxT [Candidatus Cellulosilyticum pullistercoris]|uniref:Pyridoxal 5'-phosphate synthase subunit PdxT n=1 Tax=Candidatus Cellulosilyticum pullistercoris TaxID=2838521 RepID=A0A9E2KBU8_9FIRM|nr:pyridoxal 5'-phosphate synthase glutaminase subunit PdxT [Candidatus Cellulosilyticum pullistercoris]